MKEDQYKESIKFLRGRNREIKLDGQSSERKNEDPRNWLNDTEMKEKLEEDNKRNESNWDTQRKNHIEEVVFV